MMQWAGHARALPSAVATTHNDGRVSQVAAWDAHLQRQSHSALLVSREIQICRGRQLKSALRDCPDYYLHWKAGRA